jgi:hypothetical protein
MANCKNSGSFWQSRVAHQPDGEFVINEEDPTTGICRGTHSSGNRPVAGRCTGKVIWLLLPADSPEYIYVGEITGNDIIGDRLPFTGGDKKRVDALAPPDEWVAEKILALASEDSAS